MRQQAGEGREVDTLHGRSIMPWWAQGVSPEKLAQLAQLSIGLERGC